MGGVTLKVGGVALQGGGGALWLVSLAPAALTRRSLIRLLRGCQVTTLVLSQFHLLGLPLYVLLQPLQHAVPPHLGFGILKLKASHIKVWKAKRFQTLLPPCRSS